MKDSAEKIVRALAELNDISEHLGYACRGRQCRSCESRRLAKRARRYLATKKRSRNAKGKR